MSACDACVPWHTFGRERPCRRNAFAPVVAVLVAMSIAGCGTGNDATDGGDARTDASVEFDAQWADRADAPDIGWDLPPVDYGPPPDVPPTCGLMVCDPGFRCCTWTLACYDPSMPFLCPSPDGSTPWDGGNCGGTACAPGLVCCMTTLRCVDPTVPALCPSDDAGVCAGVMCPLGWRCCPTTRACYDDRNPESCPPTGDAGGDARSDAADGRG